MMTSYKHYVHNVNHVLHTHIHLSRRTSWHVHKLTCMQIPVYSHCCRDARTAHAHPHTVTRTTTHTHTHTHTQTASTHTHRHDTRPRIAFMHASLRMHVFVRACSTHRHIPALSFAHRTGPLLWTKSSTSPLAAETDTSAHAAVCLCRPQADCGPCPRRISRPLCRPPGSHSLP